VFIDSYGEEIAQQICTLPPQKMPICLRVNTLKASTGEIEGELLSLGDTPIKSTIASDIIRTNLPISEIKHLIDGGKVFVQDESSRVSSQLLMAEEGDIVLDACACPGGKSFSIAIDMKNKGTLYSRDLHQSKLSLITKGAKNLGIDIINVDVQNAKEYREDFEEKFDRVLCDVPCSGLGVIFKKPDIKYKSTDAYKNLPSVQYDILNNCAKYVKKGGVLVYSTCTLNSMENEKNIEKFLSENKDFLPYDFEIGTIKSSKGGYTFLPHITSTDGFFVARLVKNK
jgi:16S rRNA (cytosine967-C5)-methyltransferase